MHFFRHRGPLNSLPIRRKSSALKSASVTVANTPEKVPSEPPLSLRSGAARTANVSPSARPSPTLDDDIELSTFNPMGRGSYLRFDYSIINPINQNSGNELLKLGPSVLGAVDGVAFGSEARAERYEA